MSTLTATDDLFTAAYRNYRRMVRWAILDQLGTGDTYLADDLTQDTFLRLYVHKDKVDLVRSPGGLLKTMARHAIHKHYDTKRNVEIAFDAGDWQFADRAMESAGGYYTPAQTGFRTYRAPQKSDRPVTFMAPDKVVAEGNRKPLVERFNAKTKAMPNGCIHWTGYVGKRGYGSFNAAGSMHTAHRIAYLMHVGPVPPKHMVSHSCHDRDTTCVAGPECLHRRCVNPEHLTVIETSLTSRRRSGIR
ncbi:HNH endonuclease [Streptomyces cyaneofuscatus]|uniref:HNH endonuclease n=1 Tax=Streptomyces cyaneofuscatus TaxID=66883 RepID=UPI0036DC47DC